MRTDPARSLFRSLTLWLLLAAVLAVVAQGAVLPHSHAGTGHGVYNADHDLTLYAALATVASVAAIAGCGVALVVAGVVAVTPLDRPRAVAGLIAGSRAPPVR